MHTFRVDSVKRLRLLADDGSQAILNPFAYHRALLARDGFHVGLVASCNRFAESDVGSGSLDPVAFDCIAVTELDSFGAELCHELHGVS